MVLQKTYTLDKLHSLTQGKGAFIMLFLNLKNCMGKHLRMSPLQTTQSGTTDWDGEEVPAVHSGGPMLRKPSGHIGQSQDTFLKEDCLSPSFPQLWQQLCLVLKLVPSIPLSISPSVSSCTEKKHKLPPGLRWAAHCAADSCQPGPWALLVGMV